MLVGVAFALQDFLFSQNITKAEDNVYCSIDARACTGLNYNDIMHGVITYSNVLEGGEYINRKECKITLDSCHEQCVGTGWSFEQLGCAIVQEVQSCPEGWFCYDDGKYYITNDCQWHRYERCPSGCQNGTCNSTCETTSQDILIIHESKKYAYISWYRWGTALPIKNYYGVWYLLKSTITWAADYKPQSAQDILLIGRINDQEDVDAVYDYLLSQDYIEDNIVKIGQKDFETFDPAYFTQFDVVIYATAHPEDITNIINSGTPIVTMSYGHTDELEIGTGEQTMNEYLEDFCIVNNVYYPTMGHQIGCNNSAKNIQTYATKATGKGIVLAGAQECQKYKSEEYSWTECLSEENKNCDVVCAERGLKASTSCVPSRGFDLACLELWAYGSCDIESSTSYHPCLETSLNPSSEWKCCCGTDEETQMELENKIIQKEKSLISKIDNSLTQSLKGKILLQVEEKGEAWYVDPVTEKKYYLRDGNRAYNALQEFGLGITNNNLAKIPIGIEERAETTDTDGDGLDDKLEESLGTNIYNQDSDSDGFSDGDEVKRGFDPTGSSELVFDESISNQLKGRIVIQVESRGEAWYINPDDGKRYYMKDGELAYQIMRYLSLGITNENLRKIDVGEF